MVTGKFVHHEAQVLDIAVAGISAVIGTTPNHPFWSVDRQDFVRADALHVGDRLKTLGGETTVTAISPRPGRHTVFNLEVQATHVYNVVTNSHEMLCRLHLLQCSEPGSCLNERAMIQITVPASIQSVDINGVSFTSACGLDEFEAIWGRPSRTIDPSAPAPHGHRNNQVHIYDARGLYLIEHHATRLIDSVTAVFEPASGVFPVKAAFEGVCRFDTVSIRRGMPEREFAEHLGSYFRPHLGNAWYAQSESIAIDVSTFASKTKSGYRSRKRFIATFSIGFRNAHKMSSRWKLISE